MGLDAIIKFAQLPRKDVLQDMRWAFNESFPPSTDENIIKIFGQGLPFLDEEGQIVFMHRYYGHSYARGNWAILKGYIEWMLQWQLPVIYDDDCGDRNHIVTLEEINEITRYWLEKGHEEYDKHFTRLVKE